MEKTWDQQPLQWRRYKYAAISVNMSNFSVVQSAHPLLFQNVYAVLDLYGKVTAVSIVSSTLVEDSESVKAPSLSADSCSEGEEDSTPVREVCHHILKLDWLYFNVKLYWYLFVCLFFNSEWEWACPGAHRHDFYGESWKKYPAVQSEPDCRPGVQLQPGSFGHSSSFAAPAALPGVCLCECIWKWETQVCMMLIVFFLSFR